jgi:hypothetical protein
MPSSPTSLRAARPDPEKSGSTNPFGAPLLRQRGPFQAPNAAASNPSGKQEDKEDEMAENLIEKYRKAFLISGDNEEDYGINVPDSVPDRICMLMKETGLISVFRENGWEGPKESLTDDVANWVVTEFGELKSLEEGRNACDSRQSILSEFGGNGKTQQEMYLDLKRKYDLEL